MNTEKQDLTKLIRDNADITLAYITDHNTTPQLHVHTTPNAPIIPLKIPTQFARHAINFHDGPNFKTLICSPPLEPSDDCHQCCQNEPVKLGCQIQPWTANWVGTAGAPVSWLNADNKRYWGILSNWHVMVPDPPREKHPQHQPTTARPPIAYLNDYHQVNADTKNYYDAAIADALHDGLHTISREILEIGPLDPNPIDASTGLAVVKSGRTTGLTQAKCTAVGASVRISYGYFDALFEDQDVFSDVDGAFSAPGDSGSLICSQAKHKPVALLFAGGGNVTIGNPIRFITDAFNLSFNLD